MVRIIYTLILTLLLSVVVQADMPTRLDSLRMFVAEKLSIAVTGTETITVKVMTHEINLGIQNVCEDLPALEAIDTILYTKTSDGVLLSTSLDRILSVERHRGGFIYPLEFVPADLIDEKVHTEKDAEDDPELLSTPAYYYTFKGYLFEYPKYTNAETDTIVIKYFARDTWLTADTDVTAIKNKYIEAAIFYSLWNLWAVRGQFQRAAFYKNEYKSILNETPKTKLSAGEK